MASQPGVTQSPAHYPVEGADMIANEPIICDGEMRKMEYMVERWERKLSHVAHALRSRTGDVTVVRNRHI